MADLAALNAFTDIRVADNGSIGVQVLGTFTATLSFQASIDGVTFFSFGMAGAGTGGDLGTSAATSGPSAFRSKCSGYAVVRFIITAYTSGIVTVIPRVGKYS